MAGVGGYMRPSNPAPVSGPGKYSQRTDGGPGETMKQAARYVSGLPYGEGQELMAQQQAAPLAAAGGVPAGPAVTPFAAPTERPDEPLTAGAPFGPGPGLDALGVAPAPVESGPQVDPAAMAIRAAYAAYPSTYLRSLIDALEKQGR